MEPLNNDRNEPAEPITVELDGENTTLEWSGADAQERYERWSLDGEQTCDRSYPTSP